MELIHILIDLAQLFVELATPLVDHGPPATIDLGDVPIW